LGRSLNQYEGIQSQQFLVRRRNLVYQVDFLVEMIVSAMWAINGHTQKALMWVLQKVARQYATAPLFFFWAAILSL
jgi:predicted acyltransferase